MMKERVNKAVKNAIDQFLLRETNARFDNPISRNIKLPLTEGLIRTYPREKTINYIKDLFNLTYEEIYPIDAENGMEQIGIRVPIVGDNFNKIEKAFNLCGYYLGHPKKSMLEKNKIYELQFEKKFDGNIADVLRKKEKYIYHITPSYNAEKIKQIGLTPKSRNSLFDYPDRSYFIIGSAYGIIPYVARMLNDNLENQKNQGKFAAIRFNLEKIKKNTRFFFDPNAKYSIYTYENISPNAIDGIEEVNIAH